MLDEKNRQQISETGVVIYLTASIDIQLRRIGQKGEMRRPLFIKNNSKEKLQQLNKIRKPFYQAMANPVYPTDDLNPRQLATQILADIKKPVQLYENRTR